MQFNIPQFIEIKDKIVGPLTMKQFLYVLVGIGAIASLWFFVKLWLFLLLAIPIVIFFLMLAFYEFNGRPFIYFIGSALSYLLRPKIYLWKKDDKK